MTHMTRANTQQQIVNEAVTVSKAERVRITLKQQAQILALREKTGVNYSISVGKARFRLDIVTTSGSKYTVTPVCEPMPVYEFEAFLDSFEG